MMTRRVKKLLEAAEKNQENPNNPDLAYMAWALVQATLPHSDPGDVEIWGRTNGKSTLTIASGFQAIPDPFDRRKFTKKLHGIPYGTIPRLLLLWITTEAVQTQKRRLELGNSLAEFMRELGLVPTGGKTGSITRLREQMKRLFQATITFDIRQEYNGKSCRRWNKMQIADAGQEWEEALSGEAWWNYDQPNQLALWPSWIELGEKFFEAIKTAPIPLNTTILKAIKNSSLALDLYTWLNYRSYTAYQKGEEQIIPWEALKLQFGTDYNRLRNFQYKVKEKLKEIQAIEPRFKVDFSEEHLIIQPPLSPIIIQK